MGSSLKSKKSVHKGLLTIFRLLRIEWRVLLASSFYGLLLTLLLLEGASDGLAFLLAIGLLLGGITTLCLLANHLHVLFDPLLVVALGQNHNPTLYLVAKGNQSCRFLVLLGNGRENRVFQENGVVLVHPGRNFRNAEELRLHSF